MTVKHMHFASALAFAALAIWACSGPTQSSNTGSSGSGTSGSGGADDVGTGGQPITGDGGVPVDVDAAGPPAPVTFVLTNAADEDLVLNLNKGWQPVLSAFSGKPPNARSILMFPEFCTAACDLEGEERCPDCPEPENVKDEKESQKREVIPAGESREVPWDMEVFVYETTKVKTAKGKNRRCRCYRKEMAQPETYTVQGCGLRLTQSAKASSKYQCIRAEMVLPSEEPQRIEIVFPAVEKK